MTALFHFWEALGMKMRVIEEIAQSVGDRFMEESIRAALYGEKKVEVQILNITEPIQTDDEDVLSWASFLPAWKTSGSVVCLLESLWDRPLDENLVWFYGENYREIATHLLNYLMDRCSGATKIAVKPEYMYIYFQKVEGQ